MKRENEKKITQKVQGWFCGTKRDCFIWNWVVLFLLTSGWKADQRESKLLREEEMKTQNVQNMTYSVALKISALAMPHICHLWHATTLFKKAAKRFVTKSLFLITFFQRLGSLDWFAAGWPWRAVQIFRFLTWEDPGGLLWLDAKLLLHRRKDLQMDDM